METLFFSVKLRESAIGTNSALLCKSLNSKKIRAMDFPRKRPAMRALKFDNSSLPVLGLDQRSAELGTFLQNTLKNQVWFHPDTSYCTSSPRPKRKYVRYSSSLSGSRQSSPGYYGDAILPDHLADFILDEEADSPEVPVQQYETCLDLLTSSLCRKTQITKVCKILGVDPKPPKPKRKYRKRKQVKESELQSAPTSEIATSPDASNESSPTSEESTNSI